MKNGTQGGGVSELNEKVQERPLHEIYTGVSEIHEEVQTRPPHEISGGVAELNEAIQTRSCPYLNQLGETALKEMKAVYEQLETNDLESLRKMAENLASESQKRTNNKQRLEKTPPRKEPVLNSTKDSTEKNIPLPAKNVVEEVASKQTKITKEQIQETVLSPLLDELITAEEQQEKKVKNTSEKRDTKTSFVEPAPKSSHKNKSASKKIVQDFEPALLTDAPNLNKPKLTQKEKVNVLANKPINITQTNELQSIDTKKAILSNESSAVNYTKISEEMDESLTNEFPMFDLPDHSKATGYDMPQQKSTESEHDTTKHTPEQIDNPEPLQPFLVLAEPQLKQQDTDNPMEDLTMSNLEDILRTEDSEQLDKLLEYLNNNLEQSTTEVSEQIDSRQQSLHGVADYETIVDTELEINSKKTAETDSILKYFSRISGSPASEEISFASPKLKKLSAILRRSTSLHTSTTFAKLPSLEDLMIRWGRVVLGFFNT